MVPDIQLLDSSKAHGASVKEKRDVIPILHKATASAVFCLCCWPPFTCLQLN
jgi:hypothetical protein